MTNGHSEGNDVTDQPARNFKGGFVIVTQPSATAQDSLGQTNHPTSLFIVHLRFRERLCSVAIHFGGDVTVTNTERHSSYEPTVTNIYEWHQMFFPALYQIMKITCFQTSLSKIVKRALKNLMFMKPQMQSTIMLGSTEYLRLLIYRGHVSNIKIHLPRLWWEVFLAVFARCGVIKFMRFCTKSHAVHHVSKQHFCHIVSQSL